MTKLQSRLLQLYFIRHGETEWSISGRHTGRTDIPLTAHGEDMARQLEPSLRQIAFARVFSSPSLRARQTCELAGLAPASELAPDLQEWNYGDYEGQLSVDIRKTRPDWDVWRDGCPNGETPKQVSDRADRLFEKLLDLEGNIALFSHGQFGCVLAARWIGLPAFAGRHFVIYPARFSIFGHENDYPARRVISLWNAETLSPAGAVKTVGRAPPHARPSGPNTVREAWSTQPPRQSRRINKDRDGRVADCQLRPGAFRGCEGAVARGGSERSAMERGNCPRGVIVAFVSRST